MDKNLPPKAGVPSSASRLVQACGAASATPCLAARGERRDWLAQLQREPCRPRGGAPTPGAWPSRPSTGPAPAPGADARWGLGVDTSAVHLDHPPWRDRASSCIHAWWRYH